MYLGTATSATTTVNYKTQLSAIISTYMYIQKYLHIQKFQERNAHFATFSTLGIHTKGMRQLEVPRLDIVFFLAYELTVS